MIEERSHSRPPVPTRLFWLDRSRWEKAAKTSDTLVSVAVIDPVIRLILPLVLRTRITPNQVTGIGFGIVLIDAWMFYTGRLELGALLFPIWYLVDCIDGKIARLTDSCTAFGYWLDSVSDRVGIGLVLLGLGTFLIESGDTPSGLFAFAFLVVYFVSTSSMALLSQLKAKFRTEGLLTRAAQPRSESDAPQSGPTKGLLRLFEGMRRRYRLTPLVLGDPEWLMCALVLGPLTGWMREGFVIAAAAFFLQKAALSASFWWRRRAEIRTI